MLLSVETIGNLQDHVLILALNLWKIFHLLDYFSYPHLQADSSNTRSVYIWCSVGSAEMPNHKRSLILKKHLVLPCLGTWLLWQIFTTGMRLRTT